MTALAGEAEPRTYVVSVAGNATPATPDEFTGLTLPYKGVVRRVRFIPKAAVAGVVTNNFAVTVRNRQAGAGAVNVATLTYGAGVNGVAYAGQDLTLSAAANLEVAAGDNLTVEKLVNGTGLAMPAGTVQIEIAAR